MAAPFLGGADNDAEFAALRAAEQTGRPRGTADFIEGLEHLLGRRVARRSGGRKPSRRNGVQPDMF